MADSYTYFADLGQEAEPPAGGILSRTLYNDDRVKVVLFAFGAGQELTEHTASVPATIQILSGEATLGLGDDEKEAQAGTFVHMPANMKHAVHAKTDTRMLLLMLKG